MRVALFDHVQRHPDLLLHPHPDRLAAESRLNNDVDRRAAGGHQHPRHGRLEHHHSWSSRSPSCSASSGGSRSSRSSCCPRSSSRRGASARRLQIVTREGMQLERVDEQHHRRALQRLGRARGEAVRQARPGARRLLRTCCPGARHRRRRRRCTRGCCSSRSGFVAAVGTAVVYLVGGNLVISRTRSPLGTLAAFVIYVGQIYQPLTQLTNARVDVITALVALRAGLRGARLPSPWSPTGPAPIDLDRPRGRIELRPRVVPPPVGRAQRRSRRSRRASGADDQEPSSWILRDV